MQTILKIQFEQKYTEKKCHTQYLPSYESLTAFIAELLNVRKAIIFIAFKRYIINSTKLK